MLNEAARRRQRWLLFAGRRRLLPQSRRAGFFVAALWLALVAALIVLALVHESHGAGRSAGWPLAIAGAPWSLAIVVTSPTWGGFSFSGTPDWLVIALFGVPGLLNASVVGGLAARWLDHRRRRRQRLVSSPAR